MRRKYMKAFIDITKPTSNMSMGVKKKIKAKVRKGDVYEFDDDSCFLYARVTDRMKIDRDWFVYYNLLSKNMSASSEYSPEKTFKFGIESGHMSKCGEFDALHNKEEAAKFLLLGL